MSSFLPLPPAALLGLSIGQIFAGVLKTATSRPSIKYIFFGVFGAAQFLCNILLTASVIQGALDISTKFSKALYSISLTLLLTFMLLDFYLSLRFLTYPAESQDTEAGSKPKPKPKPPISKWVAILLSVLLITPGIALTEIMVLRLNSDIAVTELLTLPINADNPAIAPWIVVSGFMFIFFFLGFFLFDSFAFMFGDATDCAYFVLLPVGIASVIAAGFRAPSEYLPGFVVVDLITVAPITAFMLTGFQLMNKLGRWG